MANKTIPSSRFVATFAVLCAFSGVSACSGGDRNLTIADAEGAGFEKRDQQMFQMIGAADGWGGTWSGEKVEIYQFESPEKLDLSKFESWVAEGNVSNWVDLCQRGNLMMISKGKKACGELRSL